VSAEVVALGGDLLVRRIGFGAMRIAGAREPDGVRALLRRALELGVNLIDTADSYGPERSERLIAESLHPYPDDLMTATKGGQVRDLCLSPLPGTIRLLLSSGIPKPFSKAYRRCCQLILVSWERSFVGLEQLVSWTGR
jgi:aryl-alcohol dehydrogenase-like predicted oxidoreductase